MNPSDDRTIFAETWDIAIIGAGPAGSVSASLLAARGKRVLLIEKSAWPREKVCGGCLNVSAMQALTHAGLASSFQSGQPIARAIWHAGKKSLGISAAGGAAILRSDLDAALVRSAIERGCIFLSETAAKLLPADSRDDHRLIQLQTHGVTKNIRAKMVLACDGIAGTSLQAEPWATWQIEHDAWIGASVTGADFNSDWKSGEIHMHIGDGGYVGAVRLPGGQIHFAAALDPVRCRHAGGPAPLIENILRSCGHSDMPNFQKLHFRGTGAMTRRREHLAGHRVLAVGDACSYVEPFTGEGITWAVQSAIIAADLLCDADHWHQKLPAHWTTVHHKLIQPKQRRCKALRPLVHHPALALLAINSARIIPVFGNYLAKKICESDCQLPAHIHGAFG